LNMANDVLAVSLRACVLFGAWTLAFLPQALRGEATPARSAQSDPTKANEAPAANLDKALAAEFAAKEGRREEAAKLYLEAANTQKRADFAERAVRFALAERNFALAESAAEAWARLDSRNLNALQAHAFALLAQNKKPEAAAKLRALLTSDAPEAPGLALAIMGAPDSRASAAELLKEFQTDAKLLALPIERGLVPLALRLKQNDLALKLAQAQVSKEPNNSKAWVWQGLGYVALEKAQEAADSYAQALKLDPKNNRLRLSYVQLLNELKQFEAINKTLRSAPVQDEEILQARIALAISEPKSGKAPTQKLVDKRLKKLQRELENTQGLALSAKQEMSGQIFELMKQPEQAKKYYSAVSPGERYANARLRLAVLQSEKDLTAAQKTLDALQDADVSEQERVNAFLLEAELLIKARRLDDAHATYGEGLARAPNDTSLLYARAMNAFARRDIKGLEEDLLQVIEIDPQNAQAMNALGYSIIDEPGRLEEATDYIQQAYLLEPQSGAIMDSLGWAYFKAGKYDQAIVQLRAAYEAEPEGEIAAHLGEALWALGAENEARKVWNDALKIFPESAPLKETMQRLQKPKAAESN
jgi:tetratricopeptide (TPR) repeat protein